MFPILFQRNTHSNSCRTLFLTLIGLIGLIFTVLSPHTAAVAAQDQYKSIQSVTNTAQSDLQSDCYEY